MSALRGQIVAGHRHLKIAHRRVGDVDAVDRVLHQARAAVGGGDGGGVDPQLAGHAGDDLLAPVAQDVGHGHDRALDLLAQQALVRRLAIVDDPPADDQLALRIGVPIGGLGAETVEVLLGDHLALGRPEAGPGELLLGVGVGAVALGAGVGGVDVAAHALAVDVPRRTLVAPEDLAGGGLDQAHAVALLLGGLHVVVDFQPGASRIDVADVEVVGMAQAGGPEGLAVVVQHARAEEHLVAPVAVDVGRVHPVGALAPVRLAGRLCCPNAKARRAFRRDTDRRSSS